MASTSLLGCVTALLVCSVYTFTLSVSPPLCLYVPVCLLSVCPPVCLSVCSNQLSQHDEKERLMEADRANSDLHICVICMKSLMNTSVSGGQCCASYMHWRHASLPFTKYVPTEHCFYVFTSPTPLHCIASTSVTLCPLCVHLQEGFRAATEHPNAITSLAQTMFFGTMK